MRNICVRLGASAYHSTSLAAVALVLAGLATPAHSAGTAAAAQSTPGSADDPNQEIVVTAPPFFRDVLPERSLDEEAISSYGLSTIDELLGEVQVELGGGEDAPLILVNGKRVNDLGEIGGLPVEALRNLTVLPRGSAVRAGGTASQRVVSLTLRHEVRSATLSAAHKVATDGEWHSSRGEGILTKVNGDTRINVTLRGRGDTALLESDRNIVQPAPRLPYAIDGNIVGFPNSLGEIDPALSALAGEIVTVAQLPGSANPTLADFVAGANDPSVTDLGQFRTLRPRTRNYDLNGTFATRFAPWLTGSASVRLGRNRTESKRGLPPALFVISPDNQFSPFSRNVGLALYGAEPLRSRSRRGNGELNLTLDAEFGLWSANFHAKHSQSKDSSTFERQATFGSIVVENSVDPFTADLSSLIEIRRDRISSRTTDNLVELTLNGPALTLPAGPVQAVVEGELQWNRLRSESSFSADDTERQFRRSEQSVRAALDIPLTSRANDFGAALGDLSATAEYRRIHFSDAGNLKHYGLGLIWEPRPVVRLRAAIEETDTPAPISTLGDPVIVTPDVRIFDPLTGATVDVTQITGGNPSLVPQTTRLRTFSALLRLVPKINLQLNAEYTDSDRRDFLASLPDSSAAIMLAFPDRFIRDSNGVLTTVDLRPVNFDSDREKRLRWGLSMNAKLGGGRRTAIPAAAGTAQRPARPGPASPTTYLQLTANHTIVFSDEIRIRPGLAPVDLLKGGAIGIGGGRLRHQADATASLTSGGMGARLGVNWRGKSTLVTRIGGTTDRLDFSPVLAINLRLFSDVARLAPKAKWAKGLRLSIDALNLTNDRQKVRDSAGNTPLQYQPGYREPIGRTIEFEIRKIF